MTSSAAALQSVCPAAQNSISPHRNCRFIFGGSLHAGNTCSQGWQPSQPTPAQTHICSASLHSTAPTGALARSSVTAPGGFPLWGSLLPPLKAKGAELGCSHLLGCPSWNDSGNLGNKKFMLEVSGQDFFHQIQGSASNSEISIPWKFNPSAEGEHREKAAKPTNLNFQSEGSKSFLLS